MIASNRRNAPRSGEALETSQTRGVARGPAPGPPGRPAFGRDRGARRHHQLFAPSRRGELPTRRPAQPPSLPLRASCTRLAGKWSGTAGEMGQGRWERGIVPRMETGLGSAERAEPSGPPVATNRRWIGGGGTRQGLGGVGGARPGGPEKWNRCVLARGAIPCNQTTHTQHTIARAGARLVVCVEVGSPSWRLTTAASHATLARHSGFGGMDGSTPHHGAQSAPSYRGLANSSGAGRPAAEERPVCVARRADFQDCHIRRLPLLPSRRPAASAPRVAPTRKLLLQPPAPRANSPRCRRLRALMSLHSRRPHATPFAWPLARVPGATVTARSALPALAIIDGNEGCPHLRLARTTRGPWKAVPALGWETWRRWLARQRNSRSSRCDTARRFPRGRRVAAGPMRRRPPPAPGRVAGRDIAAGGMPCWFSFRDERATIGAAHFSTLDLTSHWT